MENKFRYVLIFLFAGILTFGWIKYISTLKGINKNSKYAVGITLQRKTAGKAGTEIEYLYTYKNIMYKSFVNNKEDAIVPNGRYWVVFDSLSPANGLMLLDKIVPKYIPDHSFYGFKQIPDEQFAFKIHGKFGSRKPKFEFRDKGVE